MDEALVGVMAEAVVTVEASEAVAAETEAAFAEAEGEEEEWRVQCLSCDIWSVARFLQLAGRLSHTS